MEIEKQIELIRDFANQAHQQQTRRYSDDPYIVHPMRVMAMCRNYTEDISVLAAAILHDVLEDTEVPREEVLNFLNGVMNADDATRAIALVDDLTDIYTRDKFPKMNRRSRKQKEAHRLSKVQSNAQTIKYADIIDNTDVTAHDPDFASVYLRECRTLLEQMQSGHPELREKARERVEQCLRSLETDKSILSPR